MKNITLDHCVIHVADWEKSNYFYQTILGATLIPIGNGWSYRFGSNQLNCHGPGVEGTPNAKFPVKPGNSDLCFVWPGPIQEAMQHLKTNHVEIEIGPVSRFGAQGQGMSIYFRDPDGSLMEFISYDS